MSFLPYHHDRSDVLRWSREVKIARQKVRAEWWVGAFPAFGRDVIGNIFGTQGQTSSSSSNFGSLMVNIRVLIVSPRESQCRYVQCELRLRGDTWSVCCSLLWIATGRKYVWVYCTSEWYVLNSLRTYQATVHWMCTCSTDYVYPSHTALTRNLFSLPFHKQSRK